MSKKILNNEEMAYFCDQMAMIIEAGITPMEGISIMLEDIETTEGKEVLEAINAKCEAGESFYNAINSSEVFPKYALDMIELGEKTGKLEEVMKSLAFHYSREHNIAQNIKNAITYPFVIIAMMLVVIVVLIVKVLPIFNDMFVQLGSGLTGFSKAMMDFGMVLSKYSIVFAVLVVVIAVLYFVGSRTAKGRKILGKTLGVFVGARKINEAIAAGRFASGMSLAISAGSDMDESLELVGRLVDDEAMKAKVDKCGELTKEGKSLSNALFEAKIFPSLYSRMIMIGDKTGALDRVLENIAEEYEGIVNDRINKLISVLEPSLVIVLSIIVCLILLSVMLPLMAVMTTII